MKRSYLAILSYCICLIGICAGILALLSFLNQKGEKHNIHYFLGGTSIISFVLSWLLLKVSRKSEN